MSLTKEEILVGLIGALEKTLWKVLGDKALATVSVIGETFYDALVKRGLMEMEESQALDTISKFLTDELNVAESVSIKRDGTTISMEVKRCILLDAEKELINEGVKPFICPFMNLTAYVLRKRDKSLTRVKEINVDVESEICHLEFEELSPK